MSALRQRLARAAYDALLLALAPGYALRLWWRGRAEPLYRAHLGERFGRYDGAPSAGALWVHAVSLGETRAAAALIDAVRAQRPGLRLLLTHGTATGREAGQALLRDGDAQAWLPYDQADAVGRFLDQFSPAIGVLMETEVWPNLLLVAAARDVPMVLANARLNPKSALQARRLDALLRPAVESFAQVLAQTADDAQRIAEAGARHVSVCGNIKFDMAPDPAQRAHGAAWAAALGRDVVLAASLREGEDAPLLAAWAALPVPRPLLLIVPRHPQRFAEVGARVRSSGFSLALRSDWPGDPPAAAAAADVWLGDSLGEMALYFALARVALLGGSFAPLGGQNLIEAAACGCPVVMGPHTFNFAEAAALSLQAGAAVRVDGIAAAAAAAVDLLDGAQRASMAAAALAFAGAHRGAAERMATAIVALLPDAAGDDAAQLPRISAPAGDRRRPRPAS